MTRTPKKVGRPTAYKPEFPAQAEKLCMLGATDVEIADFFGVTVSTTSKWKHDYPEFSAALKAGKASADERVVRSLYQRATGYTFDSEEIFCRDGKVTRVPVRKHMAPDTTACIFWLKNRRRDEWRDVQMHEHGEPGAFRELPDEQLDSEIAKRLKDIRASASPKPTEH